MNTDFIAGAQARFHAAFEQALLHALDGTGLESRFADGTEPGTDECMPWLQRPGSAGRSGYWAACGLSVDRAVPPVLWPSFVSVSWVAEDEAADTVRSCYLLDIRLTGTGSRDAHVLAAIAVAAVLRHIAQGCPHQPAGSHRQPTGHAAQVYPGPSPACKNSKGTRLTSWRG